MTTRLRLAFGSGDFRDKPSLSPRMRKICSNLRNEYSYLKNDIKKVEQFFSENPEYDSVEKEMDVDKEIIVIQVISEKLESGGRLFVLQCFLSTFKDINYISFTKIGRMMAEGVMLHNDGRVEVAHDDQMWIFR